MKDTFRVAGLGIALLLLLGACSGGADSLDSEAARQFDIDNNLVADLTPETAEQVPLDRLVAAAGRSQLAGTTLRIVVAAPDGEFVSARSVVDRYGGTAIAYQADRSTFEGASRDLSAAQLDRAIDAAKVQLDMGTSAEAFVAVLEAEGVEPARTSSAVNWLLAALVVAAALFMLSGAWSFWSARKRRIRRQKAFVERKAMLHDWATQLPPELESLRALVVASPDAASQDTWHVARETVGKISSALSTAQSAADLDLAEMDISRTAMRLRDLRRAVG